MLILPACAMPLFFTIIPNAVTGSYDSFISCVQTVSLFYQNICNSFSCAFYKLIDKISSFLLFPFPPFSHFLFSKSLSNFSSIISSTSHPSFSSSWHTHTYTWTHTINVISYSLNFSYFHSFEPLVCLSTCLFKNLEWPTVQQYVLSFIITVNINQKYLGTNRFCWRACSRSA